MNRAERRAASKHPNQPPVPKKIGQDRANFGNIAAAKGIGPNKACGHKGGISRQGSKRG